MKSSREKSRPFAVFDIDGTLIRWQLYHAVADELTKRGHFDQSDFSKVRAARLLWKKRENQDSFKQYEHALVELVDKAIVGIPVADFLAACEAVLEEYKEQVYTYTRNLIRELRTKDYLLFAISGSPKQIVEQLANYYGFDDFAGSEYEIKAGKFTGQKDILVSQRKPEELRKLVNKHHTSFAGSIGIGDSESDIPVLESVEQTIVFNPTKLLLEQAKSKHWPIIIERKNVIYRLTPEKGKYVLQQDP